MAMADYRLCDVCERKSFYDANLDYEQTKPGHPEYPAMVPTGLGAWRVLCRTCAETHEVIVRPKPLPSANAD
jgi:hypothetical protein